MTVAASVVFGGAIAGVGATLTMDIWAMFLRRAFNVPSANYCLVGRWFCHMPGGTFIHQSIARAEGKAGECTVGWAAHYLIGAVYGIALVMLVPGNWLNQPTLLPALALGLATLAFPFFVMQPSFGLGFASARAPNPVQARLKSLMAHAVFGMGLYLAALPLGYVMAFPG